MALVKCKECGREVSSQAEVCPYCGVSKPGFLVGDLVIHRKMQLNGAAVTLKIWADGNLIGNLGIGEEVSVQLEPGQHRLQFKLGGLSKELTIEINAGYRIDIEASAGFWGINTIYI